MEWLRCVPARIERYRHSNCRSRSKGLSASSKSKCGSQELPREQMKGVPENIMAFVSAGKGALLYYGDADEQLAAKTARHKDVVRYIPQHGPAHLSPA